MLVYANDVSAYVQPIYIHSSAPRVYHGRTYRIQTLHVRTLYLKHRNNCITKYYVEEKKEEEEEAIKILGVNSEIHPVKKIVKIIFPLLYCVARKLIPFFSTSQFISETHCH